jgi:hypothetical protein
MFSKKCGWRDRDVSHSGLCASVLPAFLLASVRCQQNTIRIIRLCSRGSNLRLVERGANSELLRCGIDIRTRT